MKLNIIGKLKLKKKKHIYNGNIYCVIRGPTYAPVTIELN